MPNKFKLGQKVTIQENFYAPVNGIIVRVENGLSKNDLSLSFGLEDYVRRSTKYERYDVAYEQRGFRDNIENRKGLPPTEIEAGWHGMRRNGDDAEFAKFGVKEINGRIIRGKE